MVQKAFVPLGACSLCEHLIRSLTIPYPDTEPLSPRGEYEGFVDILLPHKGDIESFDVMYVMGHVSPVDDRPKKNLLPHCPSGFTQSYPQWGDCVRTSVAEATVATTGFRHCIGSALFTETRLGSHKG